MPSLTRTRFVWITVAVLASSTRPIVYADSATLNVCAVVRSAADYSRKLVRLRGIFAVGAEQAVLCGPECAKGFDDAEVAVTARFERNRRLDCLLKKSRRAWVVVEGTFYGPELGHIDPKLPQWMKDKLKGTMTRYGHLGSYATMIAVTKIISAESVKCPLLVRQRQEVQEVPSPSGPGGRRAPQPSASPSRANTGRSCKASYRRPSRVRETLTRTVA